MDLVGCPAVVACSDTSKILAMVIETARSRRQGKEAWIPIMFSLNLNADCNPYVIPS